MSDKTIVVAHPSPDLYGSDLQLLESVAAMVAAGHRVLVVIPERGPLVPRLEGEGAQVRILPMPVLRKSALSPLGLVRLAFESLVALISQIRLLREVRPAALYVNTVTIPGWILGAKAARVPVLCHVHEAEEAARRVIRTGLAAPLLLADQIVVNSNASKLALTDVLPRLEPKIDRIYNGVPMPPGSIATTASDACEDNTKLVLIGRLSPRKGIDTAIDAVRILRLDGHHVELDICGTTFPGYEWFEADLRKKASEKCLADAVSFSGYVSPIWPALERGDISLVPSRAEPFGNTAVEAQLAGRPVIVSRIQGLVEIVEDRVTGLHFEAGNAHDLAEKILILMTEPSLAAKLSRNAQRAAQLNFGVERYRKEIVCTLGRLMGNTNA
ncbi:glycosyltransferase family 4 protein [Rhodococcus oxybenzonivorans]|uniref:glycosyltransferase family 4 protein n=1 Tax=Rhodococcus oxybenzonivorans TaxID=1990687 RepID=UPI0029535A32|nr:glycosyltransferase family 4 protein [Rhodococcus oxybenzonivorans]MDV7354474.1 glycosyltransferase family 4 protein [Rhodococcus oxybenzonivorans]